MYYSFDYSFVSLTPMKLRKSPLCAIVSAAALALAGCAATTPARPALKDPIAAPLAKNVILFIGDGMGVSTVTAMRIHVGQLAGGDGEEHVLPFETFPNVALVKTYNTNQQVPDSAGTATAIHTGRKTRAGVLNIGPDARRGNCAEAKANELSLFGPMAKRRGKAVGIVTTARLTHATPAAVYAHSPERDWEDDSALPSDAITAGCRDIAAQLMATNFDLAMGGGGVHFRKASEGGKRTNDGDDIVTDWRTRTGGQFVTTTAGMKAASHSKPLLGIFADSHMTYMLDKPAGSSEPTLSEMTATAIERLSNAKGGYYLLVEGGRIDHGHHSGRAAYALSEGSEFARAVAVAMAATDPAETLILTTADHSHVFTIAGYPSRGNPILDLVRGNDASGEPTGKPTLAADGTPYTTLGYHNGPGAVTGLRPVPDTDPSSLQQALIPIEGSETHAGEDVAIYAHGPGAENVRGVIEQNRIFDIISKAFAWPHSTLVD